MDPGLTSRLEASLVRAPDWGLLFLRLSAGLLMFFAHGLPKLLGFAEKSASFADPLHVGPAVSLSLALFAEVACALAVAAGFCTRLATLPVLFTMGIAFFVIHADDPFKVQEKAVLFAVLYGTLLLTGPGRYSLDAWLARGRGRG